MSDKMFTKVMYWLRPGVGIKRWCVLLGLGVLLLAIAIAMVILRYYYPVLNDSNIYLRGDFIWTRAVLLLLGGIIVIVYAFMKVSKEIIEPFAPTGRSVASVVAERRRKSRGPRIVVIGGGTGMSTMLRGLKEYTSNITAIVTMADDGGSSGKLRRDLGVLPPGDLRNCIVALADDEALLTQLFKYRFGDGDSIKGHSFGNLFITAMSEVTGSFERALAVSGQVLAIGGRVLPSTLEDVKLIADIRQQVGNTVHRVVGESAIPQEIGVIERVHLEPENVSAHPHALSAILSAELIVLGPGSLYTSVIPNLLVVDIASAIENSRGLKVYVSNLATQMGETDRFSLSMHTEVINQYVDESFRLVLSNNRYVGKLLPKMAWVKVDTDISLGWDIVGRDLVDETSPWRHDPDKLARALVELLDERSTNAVL
ncbi:MAG: hypothetical protein CL789_03185 [Chloroflexi bacterium]|nr:hypothetical protein [Chloroflexota bacterium]